MRNGHIAAASWLVRNTLDGCQATNKIMDTGYARSRESGGLVFFILLLLFVWLSVCFLDCFVAVFLYVSFIAFMSFCFS